MPPTTIVAYPQLGHSHSLSVQPITLKFEEVVYKVKIRKQSSGCCSVFSGNGGAGEGEKVILNGISGVVTSGEILGMLGPSGSGKTTLLTALGGRLNCRKGGMLSGKITYNGQPFSGTMRRRTGFVAQDDVFYPHLTVRDTLVFTALLRLPSTLTRAEKVAQADQVMAELGLDRVADTVVGGPRLRGISGGEKKRLSIGLEMLINPSLLLLDEPTSGLDSTTAQRILTTLKRLASGGRTVITTIHQPSSRIYHMFDKIILLSEGSPIYYGRGSAALEYFASVGFSTTATVNPADLMLDLANGIAPDVDDDNGSKHAMECDGSESNSNSNSNSTITSNTTRKQQEEQQSIRQVLISAYDKNIATRLKTELCTVDSNNNNNSYATKNSTKIREQRHWNTSWCEQFSVLLSRSLKERRHEAFHKLRIFQVISVAILAGLLWWQTPTSHIQDRTALLFFFSVFWGFYPLYNAVFTFPQERSMLIKERSSGMYRLSSYFLARTAGDLPMELALPTAFTIIIYWMGGLKPDAATFILSLLIVLFAVLVSQSLGLAFGAILLDVKQATTLASVTTLVFLVAGGYYVQHIPPFIIWLKYLSYSFYCYKLLVGVHYQENDVYECSPGVMCRAADFPSIRSVGLNHIWLDVCIMALMLAGYRLLAYMALQRVILK